MIDNIFLNCDDEITLDQGNRGEAWVRVQHDRYGRIQIGSFMSDEVPLSDECASALYRWLKDKS